MGNAIGDGAEAVAGGSVLTDQPPWPVRRRTSWIAAAVLLALLGAGGLALGVAAALTDGVGLCRGGRLRRAVLRPRRGGRDRQRAGGLGGGAVLLVVALLVCGYLLWCVVDLLRGRLALGLVVLTPRGIYHRSWAMRAYVPRLEVVAVAGADVRGHRVQVMAAANASGPRCTTASCTCATAAWSMSSST